MNWHINRKPWPSAGKSGSCFSCCICRLHVYVCNGEIYNIINCTLILMISMMIPIKRCIKATISIEIVCHTHQKIKLQWPYSLKTLREVWQISRNAYIIFHHISAALPTLHPIQYFSPGHTQPAVTQ